MSYCLVVVDMQTKFHASQCRRTIKRVRGVIGKAIKDKAKIVILEYDGVTRYGPTDDRINEVVKDYPYLHRISKNIDDGSRAIKHSIPEWELAPIQKFLVCGVNTAFCVRSTALGLKEWFTDKEVHVLIGACNQPNDWGDGYSNRNIIRDLRKNGVIC